MAEYPLHARWQTDGKFFRAGHTRVWMRAVTYGPFPGGWPAGFLPDFQRMAAAGFNVVRLFEMPDERLLDEAWACGLRVFGGLKWGHNADFFRCPALYEAALTSMSHGLKAIAGHPGMAGVYVGNEVPADLVRWMGPLRVRVAIEQLIARGRRCAPDLLFAYANYPSTEYLEPANADFSAFNVYLEQPTTFRHYLKRLHHIAGDRPLVISEFGLDSRRNGLQRQAEALAWATHISQQEETAGLSLYAWSDRWWNAGAEVLDWDFGLIDRNGHEKPALAVMRQPIPKPAPVGQNLSCSVIICTRNGLPRIGKCLHAARQLTGGGFEILVVDDGSTDGTADFVSKNHPDVRLLRLDPCGLSAARNAGAAASNGDILAFTDDDCQVDSEWLARLRSVFATGRFAAVGGPNLPPPPQCWQEAIVSAAPGAPSHVMLDDVEAEHLPGCNLAVTKVAFQSIGGFDAVFHTAGDDVDFCWRLRAAGFLLGFAPGAFVWHSRRPSLTAFLRQQLGYGRAERLLMAKHPQHFSPDGGAKWCGFVYGGGPVRVMADSIIDHGPMGNAGYQSVINRTLPLRDLAPRFNHWHTRLALRLVAWWVPLLRSWMRTGSLAMGKSPGHLTKPQIPHADTACEEFRIPPSDGCSRELILRRLIEAGWQAGSPTDAWDATRDTTRVLLATEHAENGDKHLLVRVWGDRAAFESVLHDSMSL